MRHQATSDAIAWLRFPFIFLVILLHGYSVVRIPGDHTLFSKTAYPLSFWLGETGVPGFFFISGYLFFLSQKRYGEKLKSRLNTLLVPYLIWNVLLLVAYLAAYAIGYPQNINGKNIADYEWLDYLRLFWDRGSFDNGNFVPLLCPYWYIRNLLILAVLSPVVYVLARYVRELFLMGVAVWWMLTPHNAFIPQSVFFFSFGAYFSIHRQAPIEVFTRHKHWLIAQCLVLGLFDVVTHVVYPPHSTCRFTVWHSSLTSRLCSYWPITVPREALSRLCSPTRLSSCSAFTTRSLW